MCWKGSLFIKRALMSQGERYRGKKGRDPNFPLNPILIEKWQQKLSSSTVN